MADNLEYTTTGKPHPYHILRPSIWPLVAAIAAGLLAAGMLLFMHEVEIAAVKIGSHALIIGILAVIAVMFFWWKDIIFESVNEKVHNKITEFSMRYGMAMFIASEVMFFIAFFWAYFASSLFPAEVGGFIWPPVGIEVIGPFGLPLLMTMILLLSGCTVTWAHHAILENKNDETVKALGISTALGAIFLCFQVYEYGHVTFGFTEGIYPSVFYMLTGFHGFHVFVGTVFLGVCFLRARKKQFTPEKHFGFEAAAWYWHFVDVVWLFLFIAVYWWGNVVGVDHSALMTATDITG